MKKINCNYHVKEFYGLLQFSKKISVVINVIKHN